MHGIVKAEEGHEGVFVPFLHLLRRLLKAGEHGALAAGEVFAGIAVLADLRKHLLHDDELVGHKGKVHDKFPLPGKALDVEDGVCEGKEVAQHGIVGVVDRGKRLFRLGRLTQYALLDDLVHRGGGEAEADLEARLYAGKFVGAYADDLVNGLLPGADDPHLAMTFAAQLFRERLEVQEHVRIRAHVLAHFVGHEQKAEIIALAVHVFADVLDQAGNGELHGAFVREPGAGVVLAHVQRFHQRGDDVLAVEGEGLARLLPAFAAALFKGGAESRCFALLVDVLFQHGDLEIVAVEAEVVVKHLGEDAQHRRLVLIDGAFDVDVEEDGLGLCASGAVDEHEGAGVVGEFLTETLHRAHAADLAVV